MTTTARTVVTFDEVPGLVGTDLGHSDWIEITQERINTFADAADDHQWIHTDVERAKDGPFKTTIAHGFLTLSLVIPMWSQLFDVSDVTTKLNYGMDKVRFTNPVPAGSRVRMHATIAEVTEVKGDGLHIVVDCTIQIEGVERPAVIVTFLARFYR